jgi:hypothetical protein
MMGKKQEIEHALLEFEHKQPAPLKWEPGLDRGALSGRYRRSPLSRLQEGEILGRRPEGGKGEGVKSGGVKDGKVGGKEGRVWAVFGTELGGVNDIGEALSASGVPVERFQAVADGQMPKGKPAYEAFKWVLKRHADGGKGGVLFIPPEANWEPGWVEMVPSLLRQSKKSALKVVFGGNPTQALAWAVAGREFVSDKQVGVMTVQPILGSALRFWLKDVGFEVLDSVHLLSRIEAATGGFSRNLESLAGEFGTRGGEPSEVIAAFAEKSAAALRDHGVDPGMKVFMDQLAQHGDGLTADDMLALSEMCDPSFTDGGITRKMAPAATVLWAEAMGFAFRSGRRGEQKEIWMPNPGLRPGVSSSDRAA